MLGRWAHVKVQGRSQTKRIYSVYVPVKSTGETSVYMQQARYHVKQGDNQCPREIMMEDLKRDIKEAREMKNVIGRDFNTLKPRGPKSWMMGD